VVCFLIEKPNRSKNDFQIGRGKTAVSVSRQEQRCTRVQESPDSRHGPDGSSEALAWLVAVLVGATGTQDKSRFGVSQVSPTSSRTRPGNQGKRRTNDPSGRSARNRRDRTCSCGVDWRRTKTVTLNLKPGRYTYVCDPHAGDMIGSFRVT